MSPAQFEIPALKHPQLRCRTAEALQGLDTIKDANAGDVVAVSTRFQIKEPEKCSRVGLSHAWMVTGKGVEAVSIFDTPKNRTIPASVAMIHVEHDTILEALGGQIVHYLGQSPVADAGNEVDMICLNYGIIALRHLPDMTRTSEPTTFLERLPRMVAAYLPENITPNEIETIRYDMSAFLSLVVSTKPKTHIAVGNNARVPMTYITITPPERN